ncbi:hypothetical protein [uncultured Campylobacter sp.]|uniref:hypothetical protein n=1 Tax=uncultured Campylobacter sp. TaxID=218934 RepID=UPI002604AA8A|nr:hypothetical protein [uncultured Campylobacter sp.]
MPKYSFETIEQMLLKCVAEGGEPELSFCLRGVEYMIIAYADRCSFQRCADKVGANASGERHFATLQELYGAPQIDGLSLKELWSEADDFYCFDFEL